MSPYEGLNLPELLNLMHPLVIPPPVSWVPQTPGWWVLAGWLASIAFVLGSGIYRNYRRNRYRREALAELEQIATRCQTEPDRCAREVAVLVKRTALAAFPREQVAGLFGDEWVAFLLRTSRRNTRSRRRGSPSNRDRAAAVHASDALALFAEAAYVSAVDVNQLVSGARGWIRGHRV